MEKAPKTWNEFFKKLQNEEFCLKLNDFLNKEIKNLKKTVSELMEFKEKQKRVVF